ncbi:MAG: carboxypeptidase-like regulatory domain-containing protein [Chloroflexota bacterium]
MTCNDAVKIALEPGHKQRQAALEMIRTDPACLARLDKLARAILSGLENETSCAEARLHFATYYVLESSQIETAAALSELHDHLSRCPYCQLDYQAFQEAETAQTGSLDEEQTTPIFDLSFIQEPLPEIIPLSQIWGADKVARTLVNQIKITISKGAAVIDSLTPQLQAGTFSMAMRGGNDDVDYAVLAIPDEDAKIHFLLDTAPSPDGTALVTLIVMQTEEDKPLADVQISLRTATGERVTSGLTESNGAITFPRITPGEYHIQAQIDDSTWEIPFLVESG